MYSTKATSKLTGIKPETLRTWERRFGFLQPERDEKGRRLYSEKDVSKLTLISNLIQSGHPIRSLADQSLEELKKLSGKPNRRAHHPEEEQLIRDLTQALKNKDLRRFRFLLGYAVSLYEPVLAVEHILVPVCGLIGNLWQKGEISIGYEHALSSTLREELISVIRTLHLGSQGPTIILTTPKDEHHEIGLLMAGYIAASKGFECQFWGANLPAEDLVRSIVELDAKALVMSIIRSEDSEMLLAELTTISNALPDDIAFLVGISPKVKTEMKILPQRIQAFESFEPFAGCLDKFQRSEI